MKKLLIGLIAVGSLSAFAAKCEDKVYEQVMATKTIKAKLEVLLADAQENLEKISEISTKVQELAAATCLK
ncbi:MAG: hypothetical protein QE271_00775 [Bacteriovoracaceae bacterium]|nr:hypothetical protein [Bacteriovoracaceae bacterium]